MLAPETKEMMIAYAEALMAQGSPVNTLEGLGEAMMGRWKLAFTTEERYKILPPATRVFYDIHRDGRLENVMKFKDKYWDSLTSTAKYTLTPQGRLVFEFTSNKVNHPPTHPPTNQPTNQPTHPPTHPTGEHQQPLLLLRRPVEASPSPKRG